MHLRIIGRPTARCLSPNGHSQGCSSLPACWASPSEHATHTRGASDSANSKTSPKTARCFRAWQAMSLISPPSDMTATKNRWIDRGPNLSSQIVHAGNQFCCQFRQGWTNKEQGCSPNANYHALPSTKPPSGTRSSVRANGRYEFLVPYLKRKPGNEQDPTASLR